MIKHYWCSGAAGKAKEVLLPCTTITNFKETVKNLWVPWYLLSALTGKRGASSQHTTTPNIIIMSP